MNNVESNKNIISIYSGNDSTQTKQEKKEVRVAIDALRKNSDFECDQALFSKVKRIADADIPKKAFLLKLIQYLAHYITFGKYESDYIASKKLKEAANMFVATFGENNSLGELKSVSVEDDQVSGNNSCPPHEVQQQELKSEPQEESRALHSSQFENSQVKTDLELGGIIGELILEENFKDAVKVANTITDHLNKQWELCIISKKLVETNRIEEAIRVAEQMNKGRNQSRAFAKISYKLGERGDTKRAIAFRERITEADIAYQAYRGD